MHCPTCNGKGYLDNDGACAGPDHRDQIIQCPDCGGEGERPD